MERGLTERHRRAYQAWFNMIQRCTNRKHPQYSNYGGRGIVVLSRWRKFEEFLRDMGDPPEGLTLERMDNERGYSPRNCKWATWTEQNNNRRPRSRTC